jgi:adenine-specific DNA-methyltransferase
VQDGVSIYAVKELLRHSDVRTTPVYLHLPDESATFTASLLDQGEESRRFLNIIGALTRKTCIRQMSSGFFVDNRENQAMDGKSLDITATQREKLKEVFPEAVSEDKIDWEKLRLALGDEVVIANERYVLNWAGKSDAFRAIQTPTTATLKPQKEQSVNFDTTENIFIEGENLEVLKVLQKSYYGKIKMIYIDPPYNTGNDSFVYPDKFSESKEEYLKRIGDKDEEGYLTKEGFFRKNSKENGQFHSNWLSMMYPRLFLARNLLRDDGVIFVSIDDNEVHNLRLVMNEIFGEENFVAVITVLCNPKGRSQDKYFATNHEYILIYSKCTLPKGSFTIAKEEEQIEAEYPEEDDGGKFRLLELRNTHREYGKHNRRNLFYPFFINPEGEIGLEAEDGFEQILPIWDDGFEGCWTWERPKAKRDLPLLVAQRVKERWKVYRKSYASGADRMLKTILLDNSFYTERGQKEFNKLFETKAKIFQSPKSPYLLSQLFETSTSDSDLILDFFAGTSTTAQAVLDLNKESGDNRKFICVQLPEKTDEEGEAYKAGYKTIADISRERIRRVISKMNAEAQKNPELFTEKKLDLGFKAFTLEPSNFKVWRTDIIESEADLKNQMEAFVDPTRARSEAENMAWEILLKSGYELTTPIEQVKIADIFVYSISGEVLLALEKITQQSIDAIIVKKPKRVIVLDRLFASNDQLKTNTALQMKDAGVEFRTI